MQYTVVDRIWPYVRLMRFHSPIPILLILAPCLFVIVGCLSGGAAGMVLLIKVIVGSVLVRAFACIINDIFDLEIDRCVERTKNRPLVTGALSVYDAAILLCVLSGCGLALLLTMKMITILVGMLLFVMIVAYPFAKRFIPLPQFFLGLVHAGGALICATEIYGKIDIRSLLIYSGCVAWTMGFDLIYSFQDVEDDKKIGVKSAAIFFKDPKVALGRLYDTAVMLWLVSNVVIYTTSSFVFFLLISWGILRLQVKYFDPKNVDRARFDLLFKSNIFVVLAMSLAFFLSPVPEGYKNGLRAGEFLSGSKYSENNNISASKNVDVPGSRANNEVSDVITDNNEIGFVKKGDVINDMTRKLKEIIDEDTASDIRGDAGNIE